MKEKRNITIIDKKQIPSEEPARQYYFMDIAKKYVAELAEQKGAPLTFCVTTFGCQMNARDSEKLVGILEQIGYVEAPDEKADFVIYNTCTVRENANNKVYGRLGYLQGFKKKNPYMMIGLCGCMMQEPTVVEKIQNSYRFVDLIFGTHNIYKFAELIVTALESDSMTIDIWKDTDKIVEDLPVERKYSFKSGVNIMFGCNNFCSYCIVPYVRGRERSREPEQIIGEFRSLLAAGARDITLLGQNVNSYGKDLPKPLSFAELLRNICRIEGDFTLRFMTSHPKDATKELIDVMAENPKIAKAFHLPLQSGSNRILQRMNRHYTAESYLSLVSYMRKKMPDIALTSDIIVGFPGESEEDFEATLEVLEKAEYDNIYSFIYSPRKGTPAAEMPDQIPPEVSSARFALLLEKQMEISNRKNKDYTGCVLKVLVEGHSKTDESKLTGRSEKNRLVHFEGPDELVGQYAHVRITRTETFALFGILEK